MIRSTLALTLAVDPPAITTVYFDIFLNVIWLAWSYDGKTRIVSEFVFRCPAVKLKQTRESLQGTRQSY